MKLEERRGSRLERKRSDAIAVVDFDWGLQEEFQAWHDYVIQSRAVAEQVLEKLSATLSRL